MATHITAQYELSSPLSTLFVHAKAGAKREVTIEFWDVTGRLFVSEGFDKNLPGDVHLIADDDLASRLNVVSVADIGSHAKYTIEVGVGDYYRAEAYALGEGGSGFDREVIEIFGVRLDVETPYQGGDAPLLVGGTFVEVGAHTAQPFGVVGLALELRDVEGMLQASGFARFTKNTDFVTAIAHGRPIRAGTAYFVTSYILDSLGERITVHRGEPVTTRNIRIDAELTGVRVLDDLDASAAPGEYTLKFQLQTARADKNDRVQLEEVTSSWPFALDDDSPSHANGEVWPLPVGLDSTRYQLIYGPVREEASWDRYFLRVDAREDDTGDIGFGGKYQHAVGAAQLFIPTGRGETVTDAALDIPARWEDTTALRFVGKYSISYLAGP